MKKKYEEIELMYGSNIDDAVKELLTYKSKGKLVCGSYNGTMLYSDTVTLDSAYIEITGKTKAEFDNDQRKMKDRLNKEEKEYMQQIPELSKKWMKAGRGILAEEKWELWDKIVPVRLNDLYRGMELGDCLEIVKILNNNGSLDEAREKIESQGNSRMYLGLVCSMVKELCERGSEFVDYVYVR